MSAATPLALVAALLTTPSLQSATPAPSPGPVSAYGGHAGQQPAAEVVASIRVHGNHLTADDEVVGLSGLAVGDAFDSATLDAVASRLEATGRFDDVEVRKRYASIEDPTRIAVVIVVNEGPVRVVRSDLPGGGTEIRVVPRRGLRNLMFMPILDAEDGYGFTYGVEPAYVGLAGGRSRLAFPLTWGGLKQAGIELDRVFETGPVSRLAVGGVVERQRNPHFEQQDDRRRLWFRAERQLGPLRVGGGMGWQRVSFAGAVETPHTASVDLTLDTRLSPIQPRNAVYARAAIERFDDLAGGDVSVVSTEARGFLGLLGQTILETRAARIHGTGPLPPFLQPLLGGWSSLRGFEAGALAGDTRVTGALELHVPLNSPLNVGKVGVSVFVDGGAVYDHGERFRDAPIRVGSGGSLWFALAAFKLSLSVARGRGAGTRVNFGGGFVF